MLTTASSQGFHDLHVGPLRLWTPVILAPMAGVTDVPFRRLCRLLGEEGLPTELRNRPAVSHVDAPAGLYVTEMITSRALVERNEQTMHMIQSDPLERVRSIQLYGVDPHVMRQATRILIEEDFTDHIDLNFGCPVPKVTRKGGGAALPWKRDLFEDILRAVVSQAQKSGEKVSREIPVTIKMRTGIDNEHITCFDAAQIAQKAGVAAIGLHARTQTQHYSGHAHWDFIARLREQVSVPVFGNGDVFSGEDARRMCEETGCDAIIVGRGAQGCPWIFRDIVATFHGGVPLSHPTLAQVRDIIMRHAQWVIDDLGNELTAMREMRKHIGWYLRGFSVGGAARGALNRVSTLKELQERLNDLDLNQSFPDAAQGPRGRAGGEKTPILPHGWLDSPFLTQEERANLHFAEQGISGG